MAGSDTLLRGRSNCAEADLEKSLGGGTAGAACTAENFGLLIFMRCTFAAIQAKNFYYLGL